MAYTDMTRSTQCLKYYFASSLCPVLELKGLACPSIQSSYISLWDKRFQLTNKWPFGVLSIHDSVFPERIH